jgi:hypothetical protein
MRYLPMFLIIFAAAAANSRRTLAWKILIVEGQGAINFNDKTPERKFVVRVQEEFGAPGKGLPVTFTLPLEGPGGRFKHSGLRAIAYTDADGYATLRGFKPNKIPGRFDIQVSAPVRGMLVTAVIQQTNANPHASISQKFLHVFLKHRNSGYTESTDR